MNRRSLAVAIVLAPLAALGAIKVEPIPELRPPREAVPVPVVEEHHRAWVFAGIGAALVLAALCWPRRKVAPPPPSPFTVARGKLDALQSDSGATDVKVSAIVRQYAVEAFDLQGPALTSEEVITGLGLCQSCPSEMANAAWELLSGCDLVKFAPGVPPTGLPALIGRAEKLLADMEAARLEMLHTP